MKKALLGLFILFDLALIGGAVFVLYGYLTHKVALPALPSFAKASTPRPSAGAAPVSAPAAPAPKALGGGLLNPAPAPESSTRKIGFRYHNAKAHKVFIRADFTGWKAQPMVKDASGNWSYQAQLTPGEYAYCYTADDKTFKDPANKRTKLIGRTTVSAIQVEALPAKPGK